MLIDTHLETRIHVAYFLAARPGLYKLAQSARSYQIL